MAVGAPVNTRAETGTGLVAGNTSLVCQHGLNVRHSIWTNGNPLDAPTSLLLFQMSVISVVSKLLHYALQPLGQLSITCQLLVSFPPPPSPSENAYIHFCRSMIGNFRHLECLVCNENRPASCWDPRAWAATSTSRPTYSPSGASLPSRPPPPSASCSSSSASG